MNNNSAHEKLVVDLLLKLNSLKFGRFWKNPRGVAMTRRGQVMTFGIDGQADISGILIGGHRAEIEVKTGSGRLKEDQIKFRDMILTWQGFHHQARNVDDTVSSILEFIQNKKAASNFS